MSFLSALKGPSVSSMEDVFRAKDITTGKMRAAVEEWFNLYFSARQAPGEKDCQRLPVMIVGKLCKTVFSEYKASCKGANPRLGELLEKANRLKIPALQWALVGGECFVKPVMGPRGIDFVLVRRDCYTPFARDTSGRITSLGMSETTGDKDALLGSQIRLERLREEYKQFSSAAGLRTQNERAWVAGFGRGQAGRAAAVAKRAKSLYTEKRDEALKLIRSDLLPKELNPGNQNKHIRGANGYTEGRSYIYGDAKAAQSLVIRHSGTGEPRLTRKGECTHKEYVCADRAIGVVVDMSTLEEKETRGFLIHYGKRGTHIDPTREVEEK